MKKIIPSILSICCLASYASAEVAAPAIEATCKTCHGEGGAKPIAPVYPKLNGQNEAYLAASLKAYRAGERKGGLAAAMSAQAARLSDADIAALAAYYASQK